MFPDTAVTQVRQIQRMIATGFTIEDIRGFPDCMFLIEGARSCDQITDVQRERLETIDRQIKDLERRRKAYQDLVGRRDSAARLTGWQGDGVVSIVGEGVARVHLFA